MQGPIAQIAALTIHGNAFFRGIDVTSLWPAATVFRFCKSLAFVTLAGTTEARREEPYARDPPEWFAKLKSDGVRGLRLHRGPGRNEKFSDRMTVGFVGGGGRWLIEAVRAEVSDAWEARWQVADREDPERRIWAVTYGRTVTDHRPAPSPPIDEQQLREDLRRNLTAIAAFAERHELEGFAKSFRTGIELLESDDPLKRVHHADIATPQLLPLAGRQLLAVAQAAWQFGGMGSWNDLQFAGDEEATYARLSDELFELLNRCVLAASNLSFQDSAAATPRRRRWQFWR